MARLGDDTNARRTSGSPRAIPVASAAILLAALVVSSVGVRVGAADQASGEATAGVTNGTPEAVVVVGSTGVLGSWNGTGGTGARRWTCGYYGIEPGPSEYAGPIVRFDLGPVDPEPEVAYVLACYDASDQLVQSRLVRYDPGDPLGGIAAAERALDEARRRLDLPLPQPALNPPGEQLVGVATWLWLADAWAPSSATAAIGAVSSTVTARPVQVTWDMGDGARVTCDAGVAYDPGRPPQEQSSTCTHVYIRASAGAPAGRYLVTVIVSYEVSWSASTGAGGVLEGSSRQATTDVVVRQAQAVIR